MAGIGGAIAGKTPGSVWGGGGPNVNSTLQQSENSRRRAEIARANKSANRRSLQARQSFGAQPTSFGAQPVGMPTAPKAVTGTASAGMAPTSMGSMINPNSMTNSTQSNPAINNQLGLLDQNISQLRDNSTMAAQASDLSTQQSQEGRKKQAEYDARARGASSGVAGQRVDDQTARLKARNQVATTLGREGMITGALQNRMAPIGADLQNQQAWGNLGLQGAALQQSGQSNQFNQQLASQNLANQQQMMQFGAMQQSAPYSGRYY